MRIIIAILKNVRAIVLLPVLVCCVQLTAAQPNVGPLADSYDSIAIIKQLLTGNLIRQLRQSGAYRAMDQSLFKKLLKDSTIMDSLGVILIQKMRHLKNMAVSAGQSGAINTISFSKQLLEQQVGKLMQVREIKELISQATGIAKQPLLQWKGGGINISGQTTARSITDANASVNNSMLAGDWLVMGMPVSMQFMRQDFAGPGYYCRNTFSFRFNRETWLNSLRDKVKLRIKDAGLLPDYNDMIQKMKETAADALRSSLDSINIIYKGGLSRALEKLGDAGTLFNADISVLQDRLLSAEFLQNIEQEKSLLAQIQQQRNNGRVINIGLYDSLLQSVGAETGVHAIISLLRSFREHAEKSGLLQKLQQAEQIKNIQVQQLLKEPDKLKSLAKAELNLNSIQKLFLNINQLAVGANTVNLSPLTLCQYTSNGFNAAFLNNQTYLFMMAGKQTAFNDFFENHPGTSLFAPNNTVMGVRAGKGAISGNHTHISLFTYKEDKSSYNNAVINTAPGSTVVATFSEQLKFNEANCLDIEVSRSARRYNNQQTLYDTLQQASSLSKQLMDGKKFIDQMAFTLQWNGEIKEKEISYDLQGTRTGKAYNNPGNLFLPGAMTAFGGGFRKTLLRDRLLLSARANFHEYEYSNSAAKWRNYNFSFHGKWTFKRGYISLRCQPYQSWRVQESKKYNIAGSNSLSFEGNYRRRFGAVNYQHTVGLSVIKNNFGPGNTLVNNDAVLISSFQSIAINDKSYYLNLQYSSAGESSGMVAIGKQLAADAGFVYGICKGMTGTTTINYNSTAGWFQQLAIKQTITGQISERLIVNIYADLGKTIKEYRWNPVGNARLDWNLQYILK